MKLKCHDRKAGSRDENEWIISVEIQRRTHTGFEARIIDGAWMYYIVAGKFQYGYYLCIPGWNIGVELSTYKDVFWNLESLSKVMKRRGAISIISAIKHISETIEATTV